MHYINYHEDKWRPLVLEPEDYPGDAWKTILKIFGLKEAERVVLSDYRLEAYGTPTLEAQKYHRRQCRFCEFDRAQSHTENKPLPCADCNCHDYFQPKKRMHPIMKYEWDMWEGEKV